jgi:hypothetical protein
VSVARKQPNWGKARRLYQCGASFTAIGERIGCRRQTVAAHCKREGWERHTDIGRAATEAAAEKITGALVAEIAPVVVASAREVEAQKALALRLNGAMIAGLERSLLGSGSGPTLVFGEGASPDLLLRRCFLNLMAVAPSAPLGEGDDTEDERDQSAAAAVKSVLDEIEQQDARDRERQAVSLRRQLARRAEFQGEAGEAALDVVVALALEVFAEPKAEDLDSVDSIDLQVPPGVALESH